MLCTPVNLWAVTTVGIAIIILAIAVLFAVSILKEAYKIWMRDEGDK